MTHDPMSFEKAFERLEQILETMNAGKTPLEESLKLFEEAEKLIRTCSGKLNSAEQKIEMLIKSRTGEVALDAEQKPRVEPYTRSSETTFTPNTTQARSPVQTTAPASRIPAAKEQSFRSESCSPSPPQSNLFNQMDELPF